MGRAADTPPRQGVKYAAVLLLSLWGGALSAGCVPPAPRDDTSVLLFLDMTGEGAPRTPPLVAVHANGAVTVRSDDGPRQDRLSPEALTELLSFVIDEGFATLDPDGLNASLGGLPAADAGVSYIGLTLPGCQNHVAVGASIMKVSNNPDNAALGVFRRVEVRLLDTLTAVQTGVPLP